MGEKVRKVETPFRTRRLDIDQQNNIIIVLMLLLPFAWLAREMSVHLTLAPSPSLSQSLVSVPLPANIFWILKKKNHMTPLKKIGWQWDWCKCYFWNINICIACALTTFFSLALAPMFNALANQHESLAQTHYLQYGCSKQSSLCACASASSSRIVSN